ncbi:MAG: DUF4380 domain-containing protein [Bacteroidota bacterium]
MKSILYALFPFLLLTTCFSVEESAAPSITLTNESLSLTVEPAIGGRIASLKLAGQEVLNTKRDSQNVQWGSTVWTSPQSDWKWPPIAAFDAKAFTVEELRENVLLLVSERDSATLLRMRKCISLGSDNEVGLTYWLTNEGNSTVKVAVWENTRLPYAGRIEFRADSIRFTQETNPITYRDSIATIHFDDRHSGRTKVFTDLVTDSVTYFNAGLAFTKYTTITHLVHTAPKQAPLEIYYDPEAGFMEFELQGEYKLLAPGESVSLRVKWKVKESG